MTKHTYVVMAAGVAVLLLAGCQSRPRFVERAAPRPSTTEAAAHPRRTPIVVSQAVTRTVTKTEPIPFPTHTVVDPEMDAGQEHVLTPGVPGLRTLSYLVTMTGDRTTARKLVRSVVTKPPVAMVVAVGPHKPGGKHNACNANYSGCVPVAADVDCAGGGNGPAYQRGPVKVLGIDIYHLDLNNDGRACAGPDDIP